MSYNLDKSYKLKISPGNLYYENGAIDADGSANYKKSGKSYFYKIKIEKKGENLLVTEYGEVYVSGFLLNYFGRSRDVY